ncbi:hypothetical protein [Pseudomonas sp. S30_BP2TU TE3576]|uniref:hypothetical protein n=1 Tax=Pseudomonas sp. S30_BP2TU TE3576 TaxID=3349329 RepID=UPI003D25419C
MLLFERKSINFLGIFANQFILAGHPRTQLYVTLLDSRAPALKFVRQRVEGRGRLRVLGQAVFFVLEFVFQMGTGSFQAFSQDREFAQVVTHLSDRRIIAQAVADDRNGVNAVQG